MLQKFHAAVTLLEKGFLNKPFKEILHSSFLAVHVDLSFSNWMLRFASQRRFTWSPGIYRFPSKLLQILEGWNTEHWTLWIPHVVQRYHPNIRIRHLWEAQWKDVKITWTFPKTPKSYLIVHLSAWFHCLAVEASVLLSIVICCTRNAIIAYITASWD